MRIPTIDPSQLNAQSKSPSSDIQPAAKMSRAAPRSGGAERRPLADEILSQGHLRTKSGKRKSRSDEDDEHQYLDAKTSKKILQIGQELADEDAADSRATATAKGSNINPAFDFASRFGMDEGSDEEDNAKFGEEEWGDEEEEVEHLV